MYVPAQDTDIIISQDSKIQIMISQEPLTTTDCLWMPPKSQINFGKMQGGVPPYTCVLPKLIWDLGDQWTQTIIVNSSVLVIMTLV